MTSLDLDRLRRRLPATPVTRFAPSPTGFLHLGHAVNAVFVWGVARALGGRVLLRVEDHDRGRSRPEFERALLEDLAWLGLESDVTHGRPFVRQSDRAPVYDAALARLTTEARVYGCGCSRRTLSAAADAPAGVESPYHGRCRERGLAPGSGIGTRLALEAGVEQFEDALLGPQAQEPATQCGDLLLRDRLGNWTYQFAVTVDDHEQNVDLVIRGSDLLASTGRQIRLARMLGRREPPVFLHHPLVFKRSGEKLSKAARDTGLRDLRAGGARPEEVLGDAALRAGLILKPRAIAASALPELFG